MKYASFVSFLVAMSLHASGCCDNSGCEAIGAAVGDAEVEEGFAGRGAVAEDECSFCCNCTKADLAIEFLPVAAQPRSAEEAQELFLASENDLVSASMTSSRYEVAAPPGEYLACASFGESRFCRPATVEDGAVTTAHVLSSLGVAVDVIRPNGESDGREGFRFSKVAP